MRAGQRSAERGRTALRALRALRARRARRGLDEQVVVKRNDGVCNQAAQDPGHVHQRDAEKACLRR